MCKECVSWRLAVVQSLSCVRLFENPWTATCQASLSIINFWSLLKTGGQSIGLSASNQSFQWTLSTDLLEDGLVGSPCSPTGSQESSPTLQFKSINSLALSFLYSPNLTSIHDYWKNHSLTRQNFVGKLMSLLFICCLGSS